MNRIKSKGRLIYDPHRMGFNKKHKMKTLIVELKDDDLDLLYQWFLHRNVRSLVWPSETTSTVALPGEHHTWQKPFRRPGSLVMLQRPMYGKHITVVGGNERVRVESAWKKHAGRVVEFEYAPVPRQHFQFWSLPVYGEALQELRFELGLPAEKDFHITIGRLYDWQPVHKSARKRAWQVRRELEEKGVL